MLKFNTLKDAARFRISENEDNYWIEDYWEAAVETAVRNIDTTIEFFSTECSDEEFFWLSEIFEEIAEKMQSTELIQVFRDRLAKVTPESYDQQAFESEHMRKWVDYPEYVRSVGNEIDYAEGRIE